MEVLNWESVESLFHAAKDLAAGDRRALLLGEPTQIREAVEGLVRHADYGERISRTISGAAELLAGAPAAAGPYRLDGEIGHGGMGAVYLAHRADDAFDKRVAIKFVRHGMDSPVLRRRFQEERRILARLDHPNIARLIDGGATENGQPYLVMEYVEGKCITDYVRDEDLDVRARVELFVQVCEAVHYAHQNLVVHRDLKPGNILIDSAGHPKLLDFGIAKLLDPDAAGADQPAATIVRMLTPDYASPEQLRGESVSTASDVYSLGAVLYELMAGARPFQLDGLTPSQVEHAVTEGRVELPSDRRPEWRRRLQGDIDNIVLKAMRVEAGDRYCTVAELIADLRRHLGGQTVHARRYSAFERTVMVARRHRTASLAASAILGVVVAGSLLTARSAVQAEAARRVADDLRQVAESERASAQAQQLLAEVRAKEASRQRALADRRFNDEQSVMDRFIVDFYRKMSHLPGSIPARRALLETAIEHLETLHQEAPEKQAASRVLARAYHAMGELMASPTESATGDFAAGMEYLRKAETLLRALMAADPRQPDFRNGLSQVLQGLAGAVEHTEPRSGKATRWYQAAIAESRTALALNSADLESRGILADATMNLVRHLITVSPDRVSVAEVSAALRVVEDAARGLKLDSEKLVLLANAYSIEGQYQASQEQWGASITTFKHVLNLRQEALAQAPSDTSVMRLVMLTHSYLANSYRRIEGNTSANVTVHYAGMAEMSERIARTDPTSLTAKTDLARSLYRQAEHKRFLHDAAAGIPIVERSLKAFREGLERDLALALRRDYAYALVSYGDLLDMAGRSREARAQWRLAHLEAEAIVAASKESGILLVSTLATGRVARISSGPASLALHDRAIEYASQAEALHSSAGVARARLARACADAAFAYAAAGNADRARTLARASIAAMSTPSAELLEWADGEKEKVQQLAK